MLRTWWVIHKYMHTSFSKMCISFRYVCIHVRPNHPVLIAPLWILLLRTSTPSRRSVNKSTEHKGLPNLVSFNPECIGWNIPLTYVPMCFCFYSYWKFGTHKSFTPRVRRLELGSFSKLFNLLLLVISNINIKIRPWISRNYRQFFHVGIFLISSQIPTG